MPRKGEYENLTGQKFNNLTAIKYAGQQGRRRTYWLCRCDCGNITTVSTVHLKSGHTKSCGCMLKKIREDIKYVNYKNGLSTSRLGLAYRNMMNRCYRKNTDGYNDYGKRGITVCKEWRDKENGFVNFCNWALSNGYCENLTIDRIDNNGNYSPNNCRWVDKFVQANNKRNTHKLKINGEIDTVGNFARRYNISYWNLLNYSKGVKNTKYPELNIEVANG